MPDRVHAAYGIQNFLLSKGWIASKETKHKVDKELYEALIKEYCGPRTKNHEDYIQNNFLSFVKFCNAKFDKQKLTNKQKPMKTEIRITVDLENPVEVKAAIEMLQKFSGVEKKETKKADKASSSTPAVEKPTATDTTATPSAIKIEQVRDLLAQKVEKNREKIKAELVKLGAANVTSMKEENYQAFMDFLNSL